MPTFSPNSVQVGPANIYVGVSNPTSAIPPSPIAHTTGVPVDGTFVGLTNADTVFEYFPKKSPIQGEQYYSPVAVYLTDEIATRVTFTAMESTVNGLQTAFDATGQFSDATKDMWYFGAGSGAFPVLTTSVFVSARQRINTAKYIIILLYKAYLSLGLNYPMSRTKPSIWKVQLEALADTSRVDGDAIGQFYIEK